MVQSSILAGVNGRSFMSKRTLLLAPLFFALLAVSGFAAAGPTRLLRTPTLSATHIAFAYANNIWIVERAGGTARNMRATTTSTSCPPRVASRGD